MKSNQINIGSHQPSTGFDALEEHGQSSSKMTLFSFVTQATEQVPGASIEKLRVWVLNLAAFQLIVSVDRNKQYKQQ